jgi:hypothetical protein
MRLDFTLIKLAECGNRHGGGVKGHYLTSFTIEMVKTAILSH